MTRLFIVDRGIINTGIRGEEISRTETHVKVDVTAIEYGSIPHDWGFGDEIFLPIQQITNL